MGNSNGLLRATSDLCILSWLLVTGYFCLAANSELLTPDGLVPFTDLLAQFHVCYGIPMTFLWHGWTPMLSK